MTLIYCYQIIQKPLTCMCEGPGAIYEDDICCQQHYEDPVGQSDQPTVPLRPPLSEGTAEDQVEAEPANQAAGDLQCWHCCLCETADLG